MTEDAQEHKEKKVMSLVEHLTELRSRLLKCIFALIIGSGVGWVYAGDLLHFIERPLTGHTYLTDLKANIYGAVKQRYPNFYERWKLGEDMGPAVADRKLNYTAPLEPFFVQLKLSMIAGTVLALPIMLYQLWMFIAPGLTKKERRFVIPFITAGTVAFVVGALFFLFIIWPVIINFSLSYESDGLRSWFSLTAYINFCMRLIVIFGLVFELPIVSVILARIGLITSSFLAKQRRFAVLASAIVAAFHADLVTMAVVWIPLYLMYEVSIWGARLLGKRPAPVTT